LTPSQARRLRFNLRLALNHLKAVSLPQAPSHLESQVKAPNQLVPNQPRTPSQARRLRLNHLKAVSLRLNRAPSHLDNQAVSRRLSRAPNHLGSQAPSHLDSQAVSLRLSQAPSLRLSQAVSRQNGNVDSQLMAVVGLMFVMFLP
jgi:hypothetical protein